MQVVILKPFDAEKNLGRAYNNAMAMIGDDDYGCLCDLDTCFLTPDAGHIIHEYARRYYGAGLLTCFTNRVSPLSKMQLLNAQLSNNADMKTHISIAEKQKKQLYKATPITGNISGMLMIISKKQWKEMPFTEDLKCLGVDTDYAKRLHAAGKEILRCDGLYIFHCYRLLTGIFNKQHLV